jgi:hypothetical protein
VILGEIFAELLADVSADVFYIVCDPIDGMQYLTVAVTIIMV